MFCDKCGSKIEENCTFCPFCGCKVEQSNSENLGENKDNINIEEKKEENTPTNGIEILENTTNDNSINLMNTVDSQSYESIEKKSIIFGILGFFFFPLSIVALCLGSSYKKKTNKSSSGFVLGLVSIILNVVMILIVIAIIVIAMVFGDVNNSSSGSGDSGERIKDYYENGSNMNYQTIGNDDYGYLTVSKDWSVYSADNYSTLQYADSKSSSIITLYAFKDSNYTLTSYAESVKSRILNYGATDVSYDIVKVGNYSAVKQQAYLASLSTYMTTWCFQDENGKIHYIAINTDNSTQYQDIVTTFRLTK